MRRILLLIFLIGFFNSSPAQIGQYRLKTILKYNHGKNFHCNEFHATAKFSNGPDRGIYQHYGFPTGNRTYTNELLYPANFQLNRIEFWGRRHTGSNCRSRQREDGGSTQTFNEVGCFTRTIGTGADIYGNSIWGESIIVSKTPLLTIIPPGASNSFPVDDDITITSHSGFRGSEYNWQYSFDLNSWNNMSGYNGNSSITLNAQEIDSNFDANLYHGRYIYFRQTACGNNSNTVSYIIRRSAPHIFSANATPVACFKDENGTIKVNFDRALASGELLSISMTNITTGIDYSEENITALDADDSYTINNLPPGYYILSLLGAAPGYNGTLFNTFTEDPAHNSSFVINEPTPVEFTFTKAGVWCNGGSDGEITITAKGGQNYQTYEYLLWEVAETPGKWVPFSNTATYPNIEVTQTETGLSPGTYKLMVRDSNACVAKVIQRNGSGQIMGLGAEIIETIEITEPDNPVAISIVNDVEPTAFGFSDGQITAQITGGTPLTDGDYNFTWTHENGTTWADFNYDINSDGWYIILENAIAGTYTLTVTDANYSSATDTAGCTIVNKEFTLNEPPLLELTIAETNSISCNNNNIFNDPWSDGELTVEVTGGVPLEPTDNNGLDYYYTWKKETSPGIWTELVTQTTNIASNLDAGNYAVNIKDANDIILGTYTNNILVSPTDETYLLEQPDLLEITFDKVNVFCNQGNDGSIDVTITGGTPNASGGYTILWNTGETTEDINTLTVGTYTIAVTDDKGCQAQASITIDEPENPIEINYTAFFQPTFTGATNGWIEATVTGGTPLNTGAYTYLWEDANGANLNSQVTETINGNSFVIRLNAIGAGIYNLTIEDKNYPLAINSLNCTIIDSDYELSEPEPLIATIALHTPISCNSTNTYGDPFTDGALEVFAEGGVQLQPTDNNGLPYYYTWKKETSPGVWIELTTQTTNIASNLDAGHYAVNIRDANDVILGIYQNNVLVSPTDVTYLFEEPLLLELSIEKQDVYCFSGSDGWAKAIISGGTAPYTISWSNGDTTEQTSNLSQGTYSVSITDSRGCQVDGNIQIIQPNEPINITYTAFATPITGGASNGWIDAQITGGTDFTDGSYTYYWQDESGAILNPQTTTSLVNGVFQIRLNDIAAGSYYLTIEDANFQLATTGDGCLIIDNEFVLYDPIEATISVNTPISCDQDNGFNDPYSDGALQVVVTGGLPFTSGQPYIYYWKKENTNGTFDDLNQNSNIATGLSNGNYALNVEDSRGVVIGVYESLNLINPTDVIFDFVEPELLEVSLSATEISCGLGNNGTATVDIIGGIAPYDIQWSNGQTTSTATGLIANNYVVYVTDARGCQASGSITIGSPGGLNIEIIEQINPTCFQGNDGSVTLNITGGVLPYTYAWNTGATTTRIDNLSEGTYVFELTDGNGCTTFSEVILEHPEETTINLGGDRTLCVEQTHELDGSIADADATYAWTSNNGFTATTAQISVSEAGTYQVTATSSLGCIVTDEIVISVSDAAIETEFLISSQAYVHEDVILLNVSHPLGETSEWIIPSNVTIVSETQTSITLHFPEENTYSIGLVSTQGACYQETYKSIVVEESSGLPDAGDAENPFIEDFMITPNPNNGQFEVHIKLAESSPIALRIFNDLGSSVFSQPTLPTTNEYLIPMNLQVSSGTYLVVLETAQETQIKRLIRY